MLRWWKIPHNFILSHSQRANGHEKLWMSSQTDESSNSNKILYLALHCRSLRYFQAKNFFVMDFKFVWIWQKVDTLHDRILRSERFFNLIVHRVCKKDPKILLKVQSCGIWRRKIKFQCGKLLYKKLNLLEEDFVRKSLWGC